MIPVRGDVVVADTMALTHPRSFEAIRGQLRVAHGMLNVLGVDGAQHPFRSSIAGYLPQKSTLYHSGPHQFDGPLAGCCISEARAISHIPGQSGLSRWTC